ncbi:hypothetical protein OJJOAM_003421 [Cupriavidus sp. H18C1]
MQGVLRQTGRALFSYRCRQIGRQIENEVLDAEAWSLVREGGIFRRRRRGCANAGSIYRLRSFTCFLLLADALLLLDYGLSRGLARADGGNLSLADLR